MPTETAMTKISTTTPRARWTSTDFACVISPPQPLPLLVPAFAGPPSRIYVCGVQCNVVRPQILRGTYSHLPCPWLQALDRRNGQHQVNLLFGLRRRAEPPEAAAAAPRRPVQQEAARGRWQRAEARWWASVRASQRTQA